MVTWWVMFCEITPHVLASWFPINEKVFFFNPVLHPIKLHVYCLGPFLSNCSGGNAFGRRVFFFIGVGGWGKPSSWCVMCRGTAACPLWNIPLTSTFAAYSTTCLSILHSVWIGQFAGGGSFGNFFGSVGSELRL